VRFVDLHNWVVELEGFDDDRTRGGEARLEAIQAAWIDRAPAAPRNCRRRCAPGQSIELLKELHILTRDGKLNQDSRRKLKQVYHLVQFIEPLLKDVLRRPRRVSLVDHGAGKSYLGFILYDLFFKGRDDGSHIYGIETREELVQKSTELAGAPGLSGMSFLNLSVAESTESSKLPATIDVVTALHACNTATDDAIDFALKKKAKHIVLVPCCQAEVAVGAAQEQGQGPGPQRADRDLAPPDPHARIRQPDHQRAALPAARGARLPGHVTELVGWEHSMKNELIVATYKNLPRRRPAERLQEVLAEAGPGRDGPAFLYRPPAETTTTE
jgi:hypothetical protein